MKRWLTAAAIAIAFVVSIPACQHDARRDTIQAVFTATDTAAQGLVAFDAQRQAAIVAAAVTQEQGEARLQIYRGERAKVEALLASLYRSIAAAALLNDDQSLAAVAQAAALFHTALAELKGTL